MHESRLIGGPVETAARPSPNGRRALDGPVARATTLVAVDVDTR
jgi:hypothetical protein